VWGRFSRPFFPPLCSFSTGVRDERGRFRGRCTPVAASRCRALPPVKSVEEILSFFRGNALRTQFSHPNNDAQRQLCAKPPGRRFRVSPAPHRGPGWGRGCRSLLWGHQRPTIEVAEATATTSGSHTQHKHAEKRDLIAAGARCLEGDCFCSRFSPPPEVCSTSITFAWGDAPCPRARHAPWPRVPLRATPRGAAFPGLRSRREDLRSGGSGLLAQEIWAPLASSSPTSPTAEKKKRDEEPKR